MKLNRALVLCGVCTVTLLGSMARASTVVVPGMSNPWLAGMPDGTEIDSDMAPGQSPVLMGGITLTGNTAITFQVTGAVSNDLNYVPISGPDGGFNVDVEWGDVAHHYTGDVNGMASLLAPFNALVGVFLDDSQPDGSDAPKDLDFSDASSRDFLSLSPELRQVFFIGDGLTSDNVAQQFIVPEGATRLYLGSMDASEWNNNTGSFTVTVGGQSLPAPEPASLLALGLPALGMLMGRRRRVGLAR